MVAGVVNGIRPFPRVNYDDTINRCALQINTGSVVVDKTNVI